MNDATDLIPKNALLEETVSVCLFLLDSTIKELSKEKKNEAVVYRLKLARNNLDILASLGLERGDDGKTTDNRFAKL